MLEKGYELIHIDRAVIKEFKNTTTKGKMLSSLECYKKLQRDWYMGRVTSKNKTNITKQYGNMTLISSIPLNKIISISNHKGKQDRRFIPNELNKIKYSEIFEC